MKTSIVIVTFNRKELVTKLVAQIKMFNPEVEVVVIDQTDREPNLCRGRNEGISKSSGEIIIFFDDDVEVTSNTIGAHIIEYKDSNILGVAGRVVNDGEDIPTLSDVTVGEMNNLLTRFEKNFWSTKKQNVEFVYGCNMSFRKKALQSVGGFDEKLPPPLSSFEEVDVSLKIRKLGLLRFCPAALVYHHRALSGGTRIDQKRRNQLYYQSYGRLIKNHTPFPVSLLSLMVVELRVLRESPGSFEYLLKGFFL
jgi:GT2 family glycosyltransferase